MKISTSRPHKTANKLNDGRDISGNSADVDNFVRLNQKLSKSRKSTILDNSGVMEEPKFPTSGARGTFILLRQAFTKAPML